LVSDGVRLRAMSNRDALLAGALTCLKEKGWSRTSVRDIAAAAGVNHAAIGYHFGSREALLIEAFTQAMDSWGAEGEQYRTFWRAVIASFGANRWLWLATIEAAVQAEYSPKLRELMAAAMQQGRGGLAAGLLGVAEDGLDGPGQALGSVQLALMSGLLVQWLVDPEHAPSGPEIVDGVLGLAGHLDGP
jgi:AcrR family transcriptional regulator